MVRYTGENFTNVNTAVGTQESGANRLEYLNFYEWFEANEKRFWYIFDIYNLTKKQEDHLLENYNNYLFNFWRVKNENKKQANLYRR